MSPILIDVDIRGKINLFISHVFNMCYWSNMHTDNTDYTMYSKVHHGACKVYFVINNVYYDIPFDVLDELWEMHYENIAEYLDLLFAYAKHPYTYDGSDDMFDPLTRGKWRTHIS